MPRCHNCHGEMGEGTTSLEFHEDGLTITMSNIPALVYPVCGESRIRGPVAEYVSNLVDRVLEIERI